MAFALLHNGTTAQPVVSAISAPIAVANPNEPTGQHLTLTTDPTCAPPRPPGSLHGSAPEPPSETNVSLCSAPGPHEAPTITEQPASCVCCSSTAPPALFPPELGVFAPHSRNAQRGRARRTASLYPSSRPVKQAQLTLGLAACAAHKLCMPAAGAARSLAPPRRGLAARPSFPASPASGNIDDGLDECQAGARLCLHGHAPRRRGARAPARRRMVISWTTRDAGAPVVQWTANAATLPYFPNSAVGSGTTYTPADLCGGLECAPGAARAAPGPPAPAAVGAAC